MRTIKERTPDAESADNTFTLQIVLLCFGLAAPFATYAIAVSAMEQDTKAVLLVGMSVIYVAICTWTVLQLKKRAGEAQGELAGGMQAPVSDLEQKLSALEDAREFFGTSLKPADMFRLVSNRVGEIVPFGACLLMTKDGETGMLRVVQSYGANSQSLENVFVSADETLAGLGLLSGEIETTADLTNDRNAFPEGSLKGFGSSAVIPLTHEGDTFAVFQVYFEERKVSEGTMEKLHAIADRISPLFLGSMAFERSLSNALTDPLTKLPNERAFHMVLENQLAESHRFRDERPLTVLAVDIKNFEELNREHGHAFGDRALSFAAEKIATQLRKMDFLARSINDEFLIVLPKASERTAIEITGRIQASLVNAPLTVGDDESVKIWLNFGWATFWKDGETSHQLIQTAYTRKQQAKSEEPGNVVFFPKEYVN